MPLAHPKPARRGRKPAKRISRSKPVARHVRIARVSAKHSRVQKADAEWAAKVKARDGGCVLAELLKDCDGPLDGHHAFYTKKAHPRLRYDVDNGAAVCRRHHQWTHAQPDIWRMWWRSRDEARAARVRAKAARENRLNEGGN